MNVQMSGSPLRSQIFVTFCIRKRLGFHSWNWRYLVAAQINCLPPGSLVVDFKKMQMFLYFLLHYNLDSSFTEECTSLLKELAAPDSKEHLKTKRWI